MRRVVITGVGAVSCLGNSALEVLASLRAGRSGIRFSESYRKMGLRSQVSGSIELDVSEHLDARSRRYMSAAATYAWAAMREAISDAGLEPGDVSDPRVGVIAAAGGSSSARISEGVDALRGGGLRRLSPFTAARTMGSNVSACLATTFQIRGLSYSIVSACASGAHSIGAAMEQVQLGKQDIVFAGASEEENWILASHFDAMGALSTRSNASPERASRPYDRGRDGFVMSAGAGMVVVEELAHARARGARIYAEIVGYGANSDGGDMVAPSGEGAVRCMRLACATVDTSVDYVNTHGTSTPLGDLREVAAMREWRRRVRAPERRPQQPREARKTEGCVPLQRVLALVRRVPGLRVPRGPFAVHDGRASVRGAARPALLARALELHPCRFRHLLKPLPRGRRVRSGSPVPHERALRDPHHAAGGLGWRRRRIRERTRARPEARAQEARALHGGESVRLLESGGRGWPWARVRTSGRLARTDEGAG
jgi:3-oxoacyl-[acyl-carrier-protein] synthase-1